MFKTYLDDLFKIVQNWSKTFDLFKVLRTMYDLHTSIKNATYSHVHYPFSLRQEIFLVHGWPTGHTNISRLIRATVTVIELNSRVPNFLGSVSRPEALWLKAFFFHMHLLSVLCLFFRLRTTRRHYAFAYEDWRARLARLPFLRTRLNFSQWLVMRALSIRQWGS